MLTSKKASTKSVRKVTAVIVPSYLGGNEYRVTVDGKRYGSLETTTMPGSCGVLTVNGISKLNAITAPKGKNGAGIRKEATKQLLDYIKRNSSKRFLVLSNNDKSPLINTTLDELCVASEARRSTTGSNIKVWIY